MAKSRKKKRLVVGDQTESKVTAEERAEQARLREEEIDRRANKLLAIAGLTVFGIFMVMAIVLYVMWIGREGEGSEIAWQQELARIDGAYADGDYEDAATGLADFGENWPGAKSTFDWNRKMGLYHFAAGEYETAAKNYDRAAQIDPSAAGMRSGAGEAYWMAGDKETATKRFSAELRDVQPALRDADRSNYYLGLHLYEQNKYMQAMQHFGSIADREKWAEELAPIYDKLEQELIIPAREAAAEKTANASSS